MKSLLAYRSSSHWMAQSVFHWSWMICSTPQLSIPQLTHPYSTRTKGSLSRIQSECYSQQTIWCLRWCHFYTRMNQCKKLLKSNSSLFTNQLILKAAPIGMYKTFIFTSVTFPIPSQGIYYYNYCVWVRLDLMKIF